MTTPSADTNNFIPKHQKADSSFFLVKKFIYSLTFEHDVFIIDQR